jgi:hypothetical protein
MYVNNLVAILMKKQASKALELLEEFQVTFLDTQLPSEKLHFHIRLLTEFNQL